MWPQFVKGQNQMCVRVVPPWDHLNGIHLCVFAWKPASLQVSFCKVLEFRAETNQLGMRCGCSALSSPSLQGWGGTSRCYRSASDRPALPSFVRDKPACRQPECSDLRLNAGSNFTCPFSKAASSWTPLSSQALSCTLGADIWDTMEQPDDVVTHFSLLAQGYQG